MRGVWVVVIAFMLLPAVGAGDDPVATFASAKSAAAVRDAARVLGKRLDQGCCFGREREIASRVAEQFAGCPTDPDLVFALFGVLAPIAAAVVIQDPALAERVFADLPLTCMARRPDVWRSHVVQQLPGLVDPLVNYDPRVLSKLAMPLIVNALRDDTGSLRPVIDWLRSLPGPLPLTLTDADVDALIESAGNSLYDLADQLFPKLPARSGTQALLRLAERRDLVVPPGSAQWVDAGGIRARAIERLESRALTPQDLARLRRLAADPHPKVAEAARRILAQKEAQAASRVDPDTLIRRLTAAEPAKRERAVVSLTEYLRAHPHHPTVREALRRSAEGETSPLVRAGARMALLATSDHVFTWRRLMNELRSPAKRQRAFETLRFIPQPVPAVLFDSLPDALLQSLLDIAAASSEERHVRLEALRAARRPAEWAIDTLSRAYLPDEAERKAVDHARARAFLDRFSKVAEPRICSLFTDTDAELRSAAAQFFAGVPARLPATAEALLAATEDADPNVRNAAAMALAALRAVPAGFAERLAGRLSRGDPDGNVARKLYRAYGAALCADIHAQEKLAAVIVHREGDGDLRQWLLRHCRLEGQPARALLERLDGALVEALTAAQRFDGLEKLIAEAERAERDPPPWALVLRLVPGEVRDAWLLEQATSPALDWPQRLRLLRHLENRSVRETRERLLGLLIEGVRAGYIDADQYLSVFAPLGYASIRALAEAFVQDEKNLARAVELIERAHTYSGRCSAAGSGCGAVPEPDAEDIAWITELVRSAMGDTRRLGLLVRLLRVDFLGRDGTLHMPRQAWEAGLTPALLELMQRPGGCRAVASVIHGLLNRMIPPRC